jgi:hypothetical protein
MPKLELCRKTAGSNTVDVMATITDPTTLAATFNTMHATLLDGLNVAITTTSHVWFLRLWTSGPGTGGTGVEYGTVWIEVV